MSTAKRPAITAAYSRGFTLIEMLVIAPIALLIITGFVAAMVTMIGDVIANHNRNTMTFEVQNAINTLEQDVRLSTDFQSGSGAMLTPQGKDGNTSPFLASNGDLILGEIATDRNPIDPLRQFVYYNNPFACGDSAQVYKNRLKFTQVIYFVRDGSLWRRTVIDHSDAGSLCNPPWQVNSCAPGYLASASRCQTNDSEVVKNVDEFVVEYFDSPQSTTPMTSNFSEATTIRIRLVSKKDPAGREVTVSSSTRVTKLGSREIALPAPAAPSIVSSVNGRTVTFSWPAVPNAKTYIVQYNINGGPWLSASENTAETSFNITSHHNDTVTARVYARNTTGASPAATNSAHIALWASCNLQNGWTNSGGGAAECAYTMTRHGVVIFKGLIRPGATDPYTVLFKLPSGYYSPGMRHIFPRSASTASLDIRIEEDGDVTLLNKGAPFSGIWLSGIFFFPGSTLYLWQPLSPQNGWTNSGGGNVPLRATKDASDRIHMQGIAVQGTYSSGTVITTLPSGFRPGNNQILSARGDSGFNSMEVTTSGNVLARGIDSGAFYSAQTMFFAPEYTGWTNLTPVAGNPAIGQLGNGWQAYGGGYETPAYTKAADGIVTLKGVISGGSVANGTIITRLPVGSRPSEDLGFAVVSTTGQPAIDIRTNGDVVINTTGYTVPNPAMLSLNNVSFLVE